MLGLPTYRWGSELIILEIIFVSLRLLVAILNFQFSFLPRSRDLGLSVGLLGLVVGPRTLRPGSRGGRAGSRQQTLRLNSFGFCTKHKPHFCQSGAPCRKGAFPSGLLPWAGPRREAPMPVPLFPGAVSQLWTRDILPATPPSFHTCVRTQTHGVQRRTGLTARPITLSKLR